MAAQIPLIVFSPLSKRWCVLSRYRVKHGIDVSTGEQTRYYVAITKHDVHDQMVEILERTARAATTKRKTKRK